MDRGKRMTPRRLEIAPGVYRLGCPTEHRLRALFAREDELRAELAKVRAAQVDARNDYASERGLLMRPSVETLRKVVHG